MASFCKVRRLLPKACHYGNRARNLGAGLILAYFLISHLMKCGWTVNLCSWIAFSLGDFCCQGIAELYLLIFLISVWLSFWTLVAQFLNWWSLRLAEAQKSWAGRTQWWAFWSLLWCKLGDWCPRRLVLESNGWLNYSQYTCSLSRSRD